jgi:hypothetical protein
MKAIIKIFLMLLILMSGISVTAQEKSLPEGAIQIYPDEIVWKTVNEPKLSGIQVAVLEGKPDSIGIYTVRVKLPPYFLIPVHIHDKDERVTVLEGSVSIGISDTLDGAAAREFPAGSYYINPSNVKHFVYAGSEGCILQITGEGPWETLFIAYRKSVRTQEINIEELDAILKEKK